MRTHQRLGLDSTLDFMRVLWALEHALRTTSKRMKTRLGVTGQQRLVLRIVERFPLISAGDLARVTWLHPSSLTGLLRRLERRGLLERVTDTRDRRRVQLRIRPSARRLTASDVRTVEAAVAKMLTSLPRAHVIRVRHALTTLAQMLDERVVDHDNLPGVLLRDRSASGR